MTEDLTINFNLLERIVDLLHEAKNRVVKTVNHTMVQTYFQIGKLIIEEEQNGAIRANYGSQLLENLSIKLTLEFGKGFSQTNLKQMRSFYMVYANRQMLSDEFNLSWSHYLKLMRMEDENERKFYEIESFRNNWSLLELQRQYDTALYARVTLNKNKEEKIDLSSNGIQIYKNQDAIKDPYVLEFLGLNDNKEFSESELEQKLIDKLEFFLLELGNGFTFVARQKRISFDEKHFRIDLVFYNRILKCFMLIDLKIGELKHQDIGQMQMYVNYFDREIKLDDENKTIGLILCQDKSESIVKYTLPEDNNQIFASKYLTVLPSKDTLLKVLNNNN